MTEFKVGDIVTPISGCHWYGERLKVLVTGARHPEIDGNKGVLVEAIGEVPQVTHAYIVDGKYRRVFMEINLRLVIAKSQKPRKKPLCPICKGPHTGDTCRKLGRK